VLDRGAVEAGLSELVSLRGRLGRRPRVLDLGCGDGLLAGELARAGADVTGVDPSRVALERARKGSSGNPERPRFLASSADGKLPLDDAAFDLCVCIHVLQHVADTQSLLSEARRVLAPNGRLVVAVPRHGRLGNVTGALVNFERRHDPLEPVLRFYTARSLRTTLTLLGFDPVDVRASGRRRLWRTTLVATAVRP
jgi:SAM-dependent methyltransferase